MSEKEHVLLADDKPEVLKGLLEIFERHLESGHSVVGTAASVEEVEELMKAGLKPTVALVDNQFPYEGAGKEARDIIKHYSPETLIIAFCNGIVKWGDKNWMKSWSMENEDSLIAGLTDLQHESIPT